MKYSTVTVLIILFMTGCAFHSKPDDNLEFYEVSHLSELEGVYKNQGSPSGFLTQIIWPDIKQIFPDMREITRFDEGHEDIEFIEVIAQNNSLVVKAIINQCSTYEKTYVLGSDFEINDGKIIIHRDAHLLTRGSGDVLLGPSYEDITLGLDAGKQGKSKSSAYAAGLVFMMFPVAVADTAEIRYERVSSKPQEFKKCKSR